MRLLILSLLLILVVGCVNQDRPRLTKADTEGLLLYPETYPQKPDLPSPLINEEKRHWVTVLFENGEYAFFDVTIENEGVRDVARGLDNKGDQLRINEEEHPGISMTGKSVAEITVDAWPGAASWAGFLCKDETILTRLNADNQLVEKMRMSHQKLAWPVMHTWNLVKEFEKFDRHRVPEGHKIDGFYYNNHFVELEAEGGRGWQTSIFNDSLTGSYQINVESDHSPFGPVFFSDLAPYYIHRYGFYEGMTSYRLDPRNIALTYGMLNKDDLSLMSIPFSITDTLYCYDAYVRQDAAWKQYFEVLTETRNQPELRDAKIFEIMYETKNELRRLCLNELKGSLFFTPQLLIEEMKAGNWEADTLARNSLVQMGQEVITDLETAFQQATDSLVRWKYLNTLGKIPEFKNQSLISGALEDSSWLVHTEARFIKLHTEAGAFD